MRKYSIVSNKATALQNIAGLTKVHGSQFVLWSDNALELDDWSSENRIPMSGHNFAIKGVMVLAEGRKVVSWAATGELAIWITGFGNPDFLSTDLGLPIYSNYFRHSSAVFDLKVESCESFVEKLLAAANDATSVPLLKPIADCFISVVKNLFFVRRYMGDDAGSFELLDHLARSTNLQSSQLAETFQTLIEHRYLREIPLEESLGDIPVTQINFRSSPDIDPDSDEIESIQEFQAYWAIIVNMTHLAMGIVLRSTDLRTKRWRVPKLREIMPIKRQRALPAFGLPAMWVRKDLSEILKSFLRTEKRVWGFSRSDAEVIDLLIVSLLTGSPVVKESPFL
jgi:hypothetical protein